MTLRDTPAKDAVTVTSMGESTGSVAILKGGEAVWPPATVMEDGGMQAGLEELSVTTAPSGGAGPSSSTIAPENGAPPRLAPVGVEMAERAAGVTLTVACRVTPPKDAETMAAVATGTLLVDTVKVAEVDPPGIVTDGVGATAGWLDVRKTTAPEGAAEVFRVTVPETGLPPVSVAGRSVRAASAMGLMLMATDFAAPLYVAVRVTGVSTSTLEAVTENGGETSAPAGTVTEAGMAAEA